MCKIFSDLAYEQYGFQSRSVRLGGHVTSIRLEAMFWTVLEEIAAREDQSVGRFLSKLHDEVLAFDRHSQNFTSLLRCACLNYLRQGFAAGEREDALPLAALQSVAMGQTALSPRSLVKLQKSSL